jgi:hypothetical protein
MTARHPKEQSEMPSQSKDAGPLRACRHLLLVAYAIVVILLTTYPWNILLLALIAAHRSEQVRGERQEADIRTAPTRILSINSTSRRSRHHGDVVGQFPSQFGRHTT